MKVRNFFVAFWDAIYIIFILLILANNFGLFHCLALVLHALLPTNINASFRLPLMVFLAEPLKTSYLLLLMWGFTAALSSFFYACNEVLLNICRRGQKIGHSIYPGAKKNRWWFQRRVVKNCGPQRKWMYVRCVVLCRLQTIYKKSAPETSWAAAPCIDRVIACYMPCNNIHNNTVLKRTPICHFNSSGGFSIENITTKRRNGLFT